MTKQKTYHGWYVLIALFIAYAITNGVILNSLQVFYPELQEVFGWNEDQVTRPAQLLFLLVAIMSPVAGILLDKLPIKPTMILGTILLTIGFLLCMRIQNMTMYILAYVLFAIGITLAGIIPSMKIITNWFVEKRGLAVGILLVGSSAGAAIFNPIASTLIEGYGWRIAYAILGVVALILILVPLVGFVWTHPSKKGLEVDGVSEGKASLKAARVRKAEISLRQAIRTWQFYMLLFVTGTMWFCIVGVIQHQPLFIKDYVPSISVGAVGGLFFTCSILGKIIFGRLSDMFPKENIMLLSVLSLLFGTILLLQIHSGQSIWLWLYAIVFGIGFSGTFTMIQLLIAGYYSGRFYGRILGVFTMIDTMAGMAGILILGRIRTVQGEYQAAFYVLFALTVIAAFCVLLLKRKPLQYD